MLGPLPFSLSLILPPTDAKLQALLAGVAWRVCVALRAPLTSLQPRAILIVVLHALQDVVRLHSSTRL